MGLFSRRCHVRIGVLQNHYRSVPIKGHQGALGAGPAGEGAPGRALGFWGWGRYSWGYRTKNKAVWRSVPRQLAMWEVTGVTVRNTATLWDVRKLRTKWNLPIKRFTGLVRTKDYQSDKKETKQLLFWIYVILIQPWIQWGCVCVCVCVETPTKGWNKSMTRVMICSLPIIKITSYLVVLLQWSQVEYSTI